MINLFVSKAFLCRLPQMLRHVCMACLLSAGLLFSSALPGYSAGLYDQPPFSSEELDRLIAVLPNFRNWVREHHETAHPIVKNGIPGFEYSPAAAEYLKRAGWDPERFFCVMGRSAAALALLEQGKELSDTPPPDMPKVHPSEMEHVRGALTSLLNALMRSVE